MRPRTLVVIGDPIERETSPARPRRDYEGLIDELGADVVHAGELGASSGRLGTGVAMARLAASRCGGYDNVYCDSEHIGLPLAFLLARRQPRPRLTMIAHYLTPAKKRLAIRLLRLQRGIDAVALHSPAQVARARSVGFRPEQLVEVPYQVDARFWRPEPSAALTHIASAGQEFRDYRTLLLAANGLPLPVRVAAGSYWSTREKNFSDADVPANVIVGRLPYLELREMYAGAHFVVVPLHNVDFQAGIITILEAMAMGKAVVVSRTIGQTGVVCGKLMDGETLRDIGESSWPEQTGIYVPPEDPRSLRSAIDYLLANPQIARAMGEAGRHRVEAELSLDHFVSRMTAIIAPASATALTEAAS